VGEKTGVSAVLGVSPSTPDFVQQAAISDMFEIQSSELATQRADAATKAFAEQMVSAHRKTSDELKGLVASGKVKETLPTKLDSAHQEKLDTSGSVGRSEDEAPGRGFCAADRRGASGGAQQLPPHEISGRRLTSSIRRREEGCSASIA
jgi:predicted outer membrane protein